jgi:hypothetical protein
VERKGRSITWEAHPWVARLVRLALFAGPIGLSIFVVRAISQARGDVSGTPARVLWFVILIFCGTAVLYSTELLTRRLAPLATLLRLTLVFPDHAPKRFSVALRTGTPKQLARRVAEAQQSGLGATPQAAAEHLLELVAALSEHDRLTRGHCERVRAYTDLIAEELGLDAAARSKLHWAGMIHDIGKLEVPREILTKPTKLTDAEFAVIKLHPEAGARLAAPLRAWLGEWFHAIDEHHERWDGRGYPQGRAGTDISLAGRIVAVADVYDVITAARSYKRPQPAREARQELARCAGSQFDPAIVRAFLGVSLGRLRVMLGPLAWLRELPGLGRVPLGPAASTVTGSLIAAGAIVLGGMIPHDAAAPVVAAREAPVVELIAETGAPATASPVTVTTEEPTAPQAEEFSAPPRERSPIAVHATPDVATMAEDQTLRIDVLANDRGEGIRLVAVDAPQNVTASVAGGDLVVEPAADANGLIQADYEIEDARGARARAAVYVVVLPVNDTPTFAMGTDLTVAEDNGIAGANTHTTWINTISPGPSDEATQTITFTTTADDPTLFTTQPAVATDGTLTYTLTPNANGATTIRVRATDSAGATTTETTATLTITPVNDLPVVGEDAYLTGVTTPIVVPAAELLTNDFDEDGDPLAIDSVTTTPSSGVGLVSFDGTTFSYDPNGFTGTDVITYSVDDGTGVSSGQIVVTVDNTVSPTDYYFQPGAFDSDEWALLNALPGGSLVADYDLDLWPGLTIENGGGKQNENDGDKYQTFAVIPTAPLNLSGPLTLELWSTAALFDPDDDVHLHAYIERCNADGTGCTTLRSVDVHVDEWNAGAITWNQRTFNLGNVSTTISTSQMLRIRLLFRHHDVWIAMSSTYPSHLILPVAP